MLSVKGIYDGKKVELIEEVNLPKGESQEVIVTFLNENVYLESFSLMEFVDDWSLEEVNSIEQVYNDRQCFFDGRKFEM
jgi:hypothetical protein